MTKRNAITITITTASAVLLVAGCAHEQRSVRTDDSYYSSGRISEYNQNNSYLTPSVGGSYSMDGSYSSGGGGYSATPPGANYSGTVGADGTYTPNTAAETSAAGAAYTSTGPQSDNLLIQQVNESLRQDPEFAVIAPNIQISAHDGAIVLNGNCQTEQQKRQILARVQKVTGVVTVNNQLNVMAGPNEQNASGLTPTGNGNGQSLYQNANSQDASTNNTLNSTSRQNGQPQLYQESTNSNSGALNPTSRQNENRQLYQNGSGVSSNQNQGSSQMMHWRNGQDQNTNHMQNGALNPTSRQNGSSQIYQNQNNSGLNSNNENPGSRENTMRQNGQNQSTNQMQSTDTLSPTSRQNGTNSIYQNNPGEKSPDTNSVQRMP